MTTEVLEGLRRRAERLGREEVAHDWDRGRPATPEHFARCNSCHYRFRKNDDGVIDMNDFHEHKQSCGRIIRF